MATRWLSRGRKGSVRSAGGPLQAVTPAPSRTPPTAGASSSSPATGNGGSTPRGRVPPAPPAVSPPAPGTDPVDILREHLREEWAPPPLHLLADATMLAVASTPGKIPEEWREEYPLFIAWPHAAGAWSSPATREMTAAQVRGQLTAMGVR